MEQIPITINETFPSERKSIKLVEPLFISIREIIDIPDEIFFNILIATTEAVNNAIIHGNQCCKEKEVILSIIADKKQIKIKIEDQGSGFNPDDIDDPRDPENILKAGGRGIFLIKSLANSFAYFADQNGSKIEMIFLLE